MKKYLLVICSAFCLSLGGQAQSENTDTADTNTKTAPVGAEDESGSPQAAALSLIFQTHQKEIREADRKALRNTVGAVLAPSDDFWWQDVEEREWTVQRPIYPGIIDSTHTFTVVYKINGKPVLAWHVDTRSNKVMQTALPTKPKLPK